VPVNAKCGFDSVPGGATGASLLAAYGPTIIVDIGFDPNFDPSKGGVPLAGIKGIKALVDTGASHSCIDTMFATQLGLPIVDRKPIAGTYGKHDVNMYLAQVHYPALGFTIWGQFAGVNLQTGGQQHGALIGRAFLQNVSMVYNGATGDVVLIRP